MRRILSIVCGLGLGLALSQFPEFSQQYAQRLGGAIDELSTIADNFDASATRQGLTREQAFARYDASDDGFIAEQGRDARAVFARFARLKAHQSALQDAGPIAKVTSFASFYDAKIAARTWQAYKPAVPVTIEGVAFAGIGFLGGYGFASLLAIPFRRRRTMQKA